MAGSVSVTGRIPERGARVSLRTLELWFEGDYASVDCATERDFYALWHDRGMDGLAPTDVAIVGAMLADRLPWVFTAGYQATLRNAFRDLPAGGWAAFAATEDTHDRIAHPGTTLTASDDGYVLDGCKSWVAHSEVVDHLIITVNDPAGDKRKARGLVVARDAPGVTITHRGAPGFLGAMSQGFARFDETPVARDAVFGFEPIRQFGRTEAKFVMLAACAFFIARLEPGDALQDRVVAVASALLALLAETETSRQVYATVDREFQACVDALEAAGATDGIADYALDRRLFRMYTDRIQRRQGYARAEARARRG